MEANMIHYEFPDDMTGIVVKASGGADSTIIYYSIVHQLMEEGRTDVPVHLMSMDTDRKPWYSHYAKKIARKIEELTGFKESSHSRIPVN